MKVADVIDKVEAQIKGEPKTVQEICGALAIYDDFLITRAIARLETLGKAKSAGYMQVFREDGGAILMMRYTTT